jgi:hypothetical protein
MVTETCTSLSSWKNPSSQMKPFISSELFPRKERKKKHTYPKKEMGPHTQTIILKV